VQSPDRQQQSLVSRRRFLRTAAVIGGAGLFGVACGAPSTSPLPTQAPAAGAATVATQAGPTTTSASAGKTVRLATLDGEPGAGVDAQLAALTAATGISLQTSKFPQSEIRQKIAADLAGGGSFDAVIEPFTWIHEHEKSGLVVPLDQYIAGDPTIDSSDFIPAVFNAYGNWDGKQWTLPYKPDAQIFFYRKDLFEDPAVQAAFKAKTGKDLKVPQTNDDLVETAHFFTKSINPDSPIQYGFVQWGEPIGSFWNYAIRFASYGGSYLDAQGRPQFSSDAGRSAMDVELKLLETGPKDTARYAWDEMNTAFLTGKVAMIENWPGLATMAEAETPVGSNAKSEIRGKVGYAIPPGAMLNGTLNQSSLLGGWAGAVTKNAKDPAAAFAAIAWLTGKAGEPLKIDAGNAPIRKSTYAATPATPATAYFDALSKNLAVAKITADVDVPPIGGQLQDILKTNLNQVWAGQLKGNDALAQTDQQWTDALKAAALLK